VKPLVYYCRWNGATLRLRGRDDRFIRGQLVFTSADGGEVTQEFSFETATAELTIFLDTGTQKMILDDMGIAQVN